VALKLEIASFSSKRRDVTEKHVLIGCKHDMLGNRTFKVLQPVSKLLHQSLKVFEFVDHMFLLNNYGQKLKLGVPLPKDFKNKVIQMAAT